MTRKKAIELLAGRFARGGCARLPNLERREEMTSRYYKKGYEIRMPVRGAEDLEQVLQALALIEIRPGASYQKVRQRIVPIYGKKQVMRFCEVVLKITDGISPK